MKVGKDRTVFRGKFVDVIERPFTTRSGKDAVWEVAKKKSYGKIVAIFALTENNEVILEKIYRVTLKGYVIELPAGIMDKKGETEKEAMRRELLEETGYSVEHIRPIVSHPLNSHVFSNAIQVYFGSGARKVQEQDLEDTEEIEVITVPLTELLGFLERLPSEMVIDPKVTACLPFLRKQGLIPDYL